MMDLRVLILGVCLLRSTAWCCCPNGWIRYDDSCYLIEDQLVDYHTAQNKCAIVNGHLVKPETPREDNFLQQSLKKIFPASSLSTVTTYFWMGGNDLAVENDWVWENNGGIIEYFNWAPGEPNNARHGNCLMFHGGEDFKWNDAPCNLNARYICELENAIEKDEIIG